MTILFIVIAFVIGFCAGLWFTNEIHKNSNNKKGSQQLSEIHSYAKTLKEDSEKLSEKLNENSINASENKNKVSEISAIINNLESNNNFTEPKSINIPNDVNVIETDNTENINVSDDTQQQNYDQPVTQSQQQNYEEHDNQSQQQNYQEPANQSQPAENNQLQSNNPTAFEMSVLFSNIEKIRAENSGYRVYNTSSNLLEYSSDVNARYIAYRAGANVIVLPNYNTPFNKT